MRYKGKNLFYAKGQTALLAYLEGREITKLHADLEDHYPLEDGPALPKPKAKKRVKKVTASASADSEVQATA
jgi:hypothetical protein